MIFYVKGDLFQSPAQVLVNTVNTVGVMGKGIASEFKRLFPDMFEKYQELCEQRKIQIGTLWLYKTPNKWILNFPTKNHWRNPSRVEYIEAGLRKFATSYSDLGIHSIAFPPLGCGNGQLDFKTQVQPVMEKYLQPLPIEVFIYPDRTSDFVEHLSPREMEAWLRSEPQNLPFAEVWEDLRALLLERRDEFRTLAKDNEFFAHIQESPKGIEILASKRKYFIAYETLLAFWQQLRTHGYSTRRIAPGIDRLVSYLIAIFAQLDYVTPVHISDNYSQYTSSANIGLQILPSAFSQKEQLSAQHHQLSLW